MLCTSCIQDIRTGKISNVLVLTVIAAGVSNCICENGGIGIFQYGIRMSVYVLALYPLFCLGMVGAGDVKLLAAIQGFWTWEEGAIYLGCTLAAAGCVSVMKLFVEQNARERAEYFLSYMRDVMVTGHWKLYFAQQGEPYVKGKHIHMTIPMLIGFLLYMGGKLYGR